MTLLILLLAATRAAAWEPPRLVGGLWVSCGVSDEQAERFAAEYEAEKQQQEAARAAWQEWWQQQPPPGFLSWYSYHLYWRPLWSITPAIGGGPGGYGGALTWPTKEQEIELILEEWWAGQRVDHKRCFDQRKAFR